MLLTLRNWVVFVVAGAVGWFGHPLLSAWWHERTWRELLALFVGWTFVGLLGCAFYALGRLRQEVESLRTATRKSFDVVGQHIGALEQGRLTQAQTIAKMLEVARRQGSRVAQLEDYKRKSTTAIEAHQLTLDIIGLVLGVKNPKPGEKGAEC